MSKKNKLRRRNLRAHPPMALSIAHEMREALDEPSGPHGEALHESLSVDGLSSGNALDRHLDRFLERSVKPTNSSDSPPKKPVAKPEVDWTASPAVDLDSLVTGEFKPRRGEELRHLDRISLRELGIFPTHVRLTGSDQWLKVKLWDFSSIGFGVVVEETISQQLHVGEELHLKVALKPGQEFEAVCEVKNMTAMKSGIRLGLRRLDLNFPRVVSNDRRDGSRLAVTPGLTLRARFKHPLLFDRWCRLEVSDINGEMGMAFLSGDASTLLFEGMEVELHFELAGFRHLVYVGRVAWVQAAHADEVKFGVQCLDIHYRLHNALCDYLIYTQCWTPARLMACGFRSRRIRGHLRFRSVKTLEDYARVLHLRRDSYVLAGKVPAGTAPEDMANLLDARSRILCAYHGDRLVGSVTFGFPNSEDTVLDSEAGFPGRKYPVAIPPKSNLIEVSRLCIDADYRGTDLLQGLFEHGLKHFLLSDRHWLLTSAVTELLPLYERIGFIRLKASYRHPGLNNQEHHLIICHRSNFIWGMNMSIVVWNGVFGDIIHHLHARGLVKLSAWERLAVRFMRLFKGLSRAAVERRAHLAFKAHMDFLRRAAG